MSRRALPLSEVYRLLEPGPVVLIATAGKPHPNVMAQSWHTMLEFEPPLVACAISAASATFARVQAAGDCVIAIPTEELGLQMVGCGNASGRDTDKFARFALTAEPASRVTAPLVGECFANLECQVTDRRMVEPYNLFVFEVVAAWIDPRRQPPKTLHHEGWGTFAVAERRITLPSKMR